MANPLVLAILLVAQSTGATPQQKANFAGTWIPVSGVNPPVELRVTQTEDRLTAGSGGEAEHSMSIRLDGVEATQNNGAVTSKAQWEGSQLVVTNTFKSSGNVQRQVWSLDTDGLLIIETSREQNGTVTQRAKSTYKRR
jgi:hypothetical protein